MEEGSEGSLRSGGGPQRGLGRFRQPVPVKEGEEYTVTVETVGRKGDGIAKIHDFTVFVPNTRPETRSRLR